MMSEARGVQGLHHVTAISGPAQENLDFYSGILGMRLVKRSVNQDDPGTYHLFYADAVGSPGTDLTFFPWAQMAPPRRGYGTAPEVSLAVPRGTLPFWAGRLERYGVPLGDSAPRFGEPTLQLRDPHGLALALVESDPAVGRPFEPWRGGPIAPERQVRGLHAARMVDRSLTEPVEFLTEAMGFRLLAQEGGWQRYESGAGGSGTYVDITEAPPGERRGSWGVGAIHHLAFRVDDEEHQKAVREAVLHAGAQPTPLIDRFWFQSVYFREPGGVLFELATDGPGFTVDESVETLGESLVLPPWLEASRESIERGLPVLSAPVPLA